MSTDRLRNSPATPNDMDWQQHFPAFADSLQSGKQVEFADIGCGFGGLLMALAPMYPDTLMLGKTQLFCRQL